MLLIKNARIVTFDEKNSILENGFVKIDGDIITEVGSMSELREKDEINALDAFGKILMPGFICTHSHIYSAFARGMILNGKNPSNFAEILKGLWWRLDKKLTHEDIYYSALTTIMDCIKCGITCIFDHHAGPYSVDGSLDILENAFRDMNMRGTLCYEVSDRDGPEIAEKGIRENSRFLNKIANSKDDLVRGLFGLHAAFTLSNNTLLKASEEGNRIGAGFHVHAAEGILDYEQSISNYGMGVVERLNKFNIINSRTILAHCVHIKEEEKELLERGNVVHNPESNMNNAVGYCDVLDLINRNILVGLGSDGFSTSHLRAMDICYVLHKHEKKDPRVMTPYDVIKLGVINNGKIASKYFKNPLGKIVNGAKADLIFVDYNNPTPLNSSNIYGHMIFGLNDNMVTHSIISGRVVMENRNIVIFDQDEVISKSREIAQKLWDRI